MAFTWKDSDEIFKGEGIYHLTWVVQNRVPLLGSLEPLSEPDAEGRTVMVRATPLGKEILTKLRELQQLHPQLEILCRQLMPDHLHVVVRMHEGFEGSIKMVARGYAQGCSKIARRYAQANQASLSLPQEAGAADGSGGAVEYSAQYSAQSDCAITNASGGAGETAACGCGNASGGAGETVARVADGRCGAFVYSAQSDCASENPSSASEAAAYGCGNGSATLFATPFIRTLARKGQLRAMIDYVKMNPDRLWIKRQYPELFTIRKDTEVRGLRFRSMDNHWLLDWPDRQMVACSRSETKESLEAKLAQVRYRAEQGAITYTAAISRGEQDIAREIRSSGYPLVIILKDGFPKEGSDSERYFKPGGIYFNTCACGRLLLLEPYPETYEHPLVVAQTEAVLQQKAAHHGHSYSPIPHSIDRWRFVAGNVMAQLLCEHEDCK